MVVNPSGVDVARLPATTLAGWRQYVELDAPTFDLLPRAQYESLPEDARLAYDEHRSHYHSRMVVVETSTVRQVTRQARLLLHVNKQETGARRGLIVSGQAATGKTTSLMELGKTHEAMVRRRYPDDASRIPVVYLSAPPKGSAKKLATEFANFLGHPASGRENVVDIANRVCRLLIDARTDLVLVDEIHNLNLATSAGEEMSDHLKYFADHIPATFVYAGIDVEALLFNGIRGRQIAGRYTTLRTAPFPRSDEWKGLVAIFDESLRLYDHAAGSLLPLSDYLHERTGGSISSLSHLLRAAAILAMLPGGPEAVTRDVLDDVILDHAAETVASPRGKRHAV